MFSTARAFVAGSAFLLVFVLFGAAEAGDHTSFFGGRLRVGGEVSGTLAPEDLGFFNYTDYETSALQLFRVDLMAEARLAEQASVLFEGRMDNLAEPRVYALYLRVRPWKLRELDLQLGLVPPVFGSFARRRYALENPLPSLPLAYQYLTSLREDALPENAEQLVAQRGRGWLVRYPIGNPAADTGVPLVNAERWDTGITLRVGIRPLSLALAVTQGTLSHPEFEDANDGKQLSGRLAWTTPGFGLGVSGASGDFVAKAAADAVPGGAPGAWRQQALGVDAEWSRGHIVLRGEAVWTRYRVPPVEATLIDDWLGAFGGFVEARYKILPGLYAAARAEHLTMSDLASDFGVREWDAPVTRFELGGGYSFSRHLLFKASWQHNQRDGGRVRKNDLLAGQVLLWF